VLEVSIISP